MTLFIDNMWKCFYISFLMLLGCNKSSPASFWIEKNPEYDGNSNAIHSVMIVFSPGKSETDITLALRGDVKFDGNRKILIEKKMRVRGIADRYKIEWIGKRTLKVTIYENNRQIGDIELSP